MVVRTVVMTLHLALVHVFEPCRRSHGIGQQIADPSRCPRLVTEREARSIRLFGLPTVGRLRAPAETRGAAGDGQRRFDVPGAAAGLHAVMHESAIVILAV